MKLRTLVSALFSAAIFLTGSSSIYASSSASPVPAKVSYQQAALAPCDQKANPVQLSADDIALLVKEHNRVRAEASKVDNIKRDDLVWSPELACQAQSYAMKVLDGTFETEGSPGAKPHSAPTKFFYSWSAENIAFSEKTADSFKAWESEKSDWDLTKPVDPKKPDANCTPGKVCGHYTSIIQPYATVVGCGFASVSQPNPKGFKWTSDSPAFTRSIVCQFGKLWLKGNVGTEGLTYKDSANPERGSSRWYFLNFSAPGKYQLTVNTASGMGMYAWLYDATGKSIDILKLDGSKKISDDKGRYVFGDEPKPETVVIQIATPGVYALKANVAGAAGDFTVDVKAAK